MAELFNLISLLPQLSLSEFKTGYIHLHVTFEVNITFDFVKLSTVD